MIGQINIFENDMVQQSIKRLKMFEPSEGYYLAFSGGKDSCVIKALADMAGVKYDAHYRLTSVDPPELVHFIQKEHPDVSIDKPRYDSGELKGKQITMWNLMPLKRMPPTRLVRYCCESLKEDGGEGRFKVTGVRRAESAKRSKRSGLEIGKGKSHKREMFDPDNPDQEMFHACQQKAERIMNPIIDWSDEDVWEFIKGNDIPYCGLYDEGFKRLGCVGCPIAGDKRWKEFERWPKYKRNYISAMERTLQVRLDKGLKTEWTSGQEMFEWWMKQ